MESPLVLDKPYWDKRWLVRDPEWQLPQVHPDLLKHEKELFDGHENIRVFVPLCGKTIDMKWFADKGCKVVGVEFCNFPIKKFFESNFIEYKVTDVKSKKTGKTYTVYQSIDGSIRIYNCDIFEFTSDVEGQFDIIWDRGSFTSIQKAGVDKYAKLMTSLMKSGCRYLLSVFEYDTKHHPGPPMSVTEDIVHQLYADSCIIRRTDENDGLQFARKAFCSKLEYCRICLYIIQPK